MKRSSLDDIRGRNAYFLARAIFRSVVDRYSTLDTFSTWTLGATGVAIGFLFTNFDKVNTLLRPGAVSWILWLLIASVAMGFIQKFLAVRVEHACKFDDQFNLQVSAALNSLAIHARREAKVVIESNIPIDLQLTELELHNIEEQMKDIRDKVQNEFKVGSHWPLFFPRMMQGEVDAYNEDSLYVLKRATGLFVWQMLMLSGQILTLFLSLPVLAIMKV